MDEKNDKQMEKDELIAKMEELIEWYDIHSIDVPFESKEDRLKYATIVREIATLKAEVEREETPINEDDVNAWLDSEDIDTTEIRWGAHFAVTAINAGYLKHNPQNSKR